jgi:5-(aminomethyl)-3-furanmethanol phosphate kinase
MTRLLVVKLGGSFAHSARLRAWVDAIATTPRPLVLVPGGGPFADAVRAAQQAIGFNDSAAHRMALLAMNQFAVALASLAPRLVPADDFPSIRTALGADRVPVWCPWPMLRGAPDIPQSWDVTSDSLALWLAARLGAARLVLVKHRVAASFSEPGLVDDAFASFRPAFAGEIALAGPDDTAILAAAHAGTAA